MISENTSDHIFNRSPSHSVIKEVDKPGGAHTQSGGSLAINKAVNRASGNPTVSIKNTTSQRDWVLEISSCLYSFERLKPMPSTRLDIGHRKTRFCPKSTP